MNLSSRSRYGIRALIDLAVNARESCIQLGDIAVRNDISVKYLEQIFMSLRKGGMIRSIKGPQGGYLLARSILPYRHCWRLMNRNLPVHRICTIYDARPFGVFFPV